MGWARELGALEPLGREEVAELHMDVTSPDKLSPTFFASLVFVKKLQMASWKMSFTTAQFAALDKLPALEKLHLSSYLDESKDQLDPAAYLPSFLCTNPYGNALDCVKKAKTPAASETFRATTR